MEKQITLYETLGGREVIQHIVMNFYRRVLADETINHFFDKTNMPQQVVHQTNFISFALGGPDAYTGKNMAEAHEGMNLQPTHFAAIASHLRKALIEFQVEEKDIQTILKAISALRNDILYK